VSIAASAWAKKIRTGSSSRKALLMVLAEYATIIDGWDPEGSDGRHYAWPGQGRLMAETEMGERALRDHLHTLETAGIIRRVRRGGSGEGRQSDLVILAVDDDGPRPFPVGEPVDTSVDDNVDKGNRQNLPVGATGRFEQGNRQNRADAPYIEPPSEPPSPIRPEVEELCELLAKRIEENGARTPSVTKAWHDSCRLLLDRDGFTVEQVRYLIEWSQRHHFWRSNILSMPTLRKQADRLKLQARQEYEKANPSAAARPVAPRFPTAQERSQQQRDEWTALAKEADEWVTANGGDPEDHKLVLEVMERIKAQRANGSATRTPDMYSEGKDVINGEVVKAREVTAGEGI
jgi:hypothetical protein